VQSAGRNQPINPIAHCGLACRLIRNRNDGIVYRCDGQLVGDYDKRKTEEQIIEMIKMGVKP